MICKEKGVTFIENENEIGAYQSEFRAASHLSELNDD